MPSKDPEKRRAQQRRYRQRHPERIRAQAALYRELHRDKCRAASLAWYYRHKDHVSQQQRIARSGHWRDPKQKEKLLQRHGLYVRVRRQNDRAFAVRLRLRAGFSDALTKYAGGRNGAASVIELLGCPLYHFVQYLESKFLPGMSWENRERWHIDHDRPLASFSDLTDPEQQRQAFHYTNLQPLWAGDNIRKGARWSPTAP